MIEGDFQVTVCIWCRRHKGLAVLRAVETRLTSWLTDCILAVLDCCGCTSGITDRLFLYDGEAATALPALAGLMHNLACQCSLTVA